MFGFFEHDHGKLFNCLSFSQEDLPWVLDVFMKKRQEGNTRLLDIEVDFGFKLFLHQRDFLGGYSILHCITHGIQKSRRVIFVLSRYPQFQNKCSQTLPQNISDQTQYFWSKRDFFLCLFCKICLSTNITQLLLPGIFCSPNGECKSLNLPMLKL